LHPDKEKNQFTTVWSGLFTSLPADLSTEVLPIGGRFIKGRLYGLTEEEIRIVEVNI
jgi:hypothetical protein